MMTLAKLEAILEGLENKEAFVKVLVGGNEYYITDEFGSWRGDYCQSYIDFSSESAYYEVRKTVTQILKGMEEFLAVGFMYGYKGGEFEVTSQTNVWLGYDGSYEEWKIEGIVWNEKGFYEMVITEGEEEEEY